MAIKLNNNLCIGCGSCIVHCPTGAITADADGYKVNPNLCTDCGACIAPCPAHATDE